MSVRNVSLVSLLALAAACSTPAAYCARADECNALGAGTSVTQCSENLTQQLSNLTPSVAIDCENFMAQTLTPVSCEGFIAEVQDELANRGCPF